MDLGLRERVCVVTGASRGIGAATTAALLQEGARVLAVARDPGALQTLAAELGDPPSLATLSLDVTDPEAPARLAPALEPWGPCEVLVNNAGTSSVRPLEALHEEDWQAQWELNVMAPMRFMRSLCPEMARRGWGRVVNVASSSGKRPSLTNMAYSVTKAAELSLSRAFADSLAARGVLVNAVAPGMVATGLWTAPGAMADQMAGPSAGDRDAVLADRARRIPLGRLAEAGEIASAIVFLCSERASNVTGAAWSVDGGTVPVII